MQGSCEAERLCFYSLLRKNDAKQAGIDDNNMPAALGEGVRTDQCQMLIPDYTIDIQSPSIFARLECDRLDQKTSDQLRQENSATSTWEQG